MSLTIWTNHIQRAEARQLFLDGLKAADCRLVQSGDSSASVLTPSESDPALGEANIAFGQPAPADLLKNPHLKWVAISTAGYTRYDNDTFRSAMKQRGVIVTNTSAVFANPCAEHVLAQMLSLTRHLPTYVLNQAGPRDWQCLEGRYEISILTGKTVVMLGFGAIGHRLAELLAPFHCRVVAVRRHPRGDETVETVTEAELPRVLASADHVVNVLPENPETRHLCNAEFFRQMKRGAYFFNVGRGTTVQQDDLIVALKSGQVGAAYLDALDPEPLPPGHPLWTTPNCHITPHLGGGHGEEDKSLVQHFLANLGRFQRGQPLLNRIF